MNHLNQRKKLLHEEINKVVAWGVELCSLPMLEQQSILILRLRNCIETHRHRLGHEIHKFMMSKKNKQTLNPLSQGDWCISSFYWLQFIVFGHQPTLSLTPEKVYTFSFKTRETIFMHRIEKLLRENQKLKRLLEDYYLSPHISSSFSFDRRKHLLPRTSSLLPSPPAVYRSNPYKSTLNKKLPRWAKM